MATHNGLSDELDVPRAISIDASTPRIVKVLVTGFGPFQDRWPVNPSFMITKALPKTLPKLTPGGHRVQILGYEQPVRVAYEDVKQLVPTLHGDRQGDIDLVLHIGMASGRKFYAIERYAHRDGYHKNKDLDDRNLALDDGLVQFGDCPAVMTTSLEYSEILARWISNVRGLPATSAGFAADCRESTDAGHYLCDYIYFSSLAWFARVNGHMEEGKASDRPVLFLHVPPDSDEEMLRKGLDVTVGLIEAMVDTWASPPNGTGAKAREDHIRSHGGVGQ